MGARMSKARKTMKACKTRKQRGGDESSRVPDTSALTSEATRLLKDQAERPAFVPFTIPKSEEPISPDPFGILSRPTSAASTTSTTSTASKASTVSSKSTPGSTAAKRGPWRGGSKTKKHRKTNRKTNRKPNRRN